MSVFLEFTVESGQFKLGDVLSHDGEAHFELERIVPTEEYIMPYVWVTTAGDTDEELAQFEERVRASDRVQELQALDRVENGGLFRIVWRRHEKDLMGALADTEATVLEAAGNRVWTFRVRFADHDKLTQFYNAVTDSDITIHVERTYTFSEEHARRRDFNLTREQREALVLALQRGYFASPSEVSLEELAGELGITKQAVSERIRRGNEKILRPLLLSSVAD